MALDEHLPNGDKTILSQELVRKICLQFLNAFWLNKGGYMYFHEKKYLFVTSKDEIGSRCFCPYLLMVISNAAAAARDLLLFSP